MIIYQNEAKYRNELEKLNEDNINDPVKLLEREYPENVGNISMIP